MRFTKMHGLGNDYIVVNGFEERVAHGSLLAQAMSDRPRGVGSDGLILIGPAADGDLRMEMYNADGSRGAMCGNGLRCVVKYAYERGLCRRPLIRVETDSGLRLGECLLDGDRVVRVRAAVGAACYRPAGIAAFSDRSDVVDEAFEVNGRALLGTYVCVGSRHLIVFVTDWAEIDLLADGPVLERNPHFPDRINVQFARVDSPSEITVATWERGSGPTRACGTGACAVADAAFRRNRVAFPITVHLPGGDLLIERAGDVDRRAWAESHGIDAADARYDWGGDDGLLMTGPAEEVFSGEWTLGQVSRSGESGESCGGPAPRPSVRR